MKYLRTVNAQCSALLFKNLIALAKKPLFLIFACSIPLLAPILTIVFSGLYSNSQTPAQLTELDFVDPISFKLKTCNNGLSDCPIYFYNPQNEKTNKIMEFFSAQGGYKIGVDVIGYSSNDMMARSILEDYDSLRKKPFFVGISFAETSQFNHTYTIWKDTRFSGLKFNPYITAIQLSIDSAIIYSQSPNKKKPLIEASLNWIKPMIATHLVHNSDDQDHYHWNINGILVTLFFPFVFLPILSLSLSSVAFEKRESLLIAIKRMGLFESAYWIAAFLPMILVSCATAGFMTVGYVVASDLQNSFLKNAIEPFVIFISTFVYSLSISSIGLFVSACFSRPLFVNSSQSLIGIGMLISSLTCFSNIFGGEILTSLFITSTIQGQFVMFLFPWINYAAQLHNIVNHIGTNTANNFTIQHFGVSEFFSTPTLTMILPNASKLRSGPTFDAYTNNPSNAKLVILSALTIPFYLALCWYFNQMLETEESFSLPWYFPFCQSYWTGTKPSSKKDSFGDTCQEEKRLSKECDSVRTLKLSKVYKTTTALKEFTISMDMGNVYGLLGHNGSGKSTTIGILSGVTSPTYGDAFVFGYNVRTEITSIRNLMGVCSQFDLLYPTLTGAQHISFYTKFRNVDLKGQSLKEFVAEKLAAVQLTDAANQITKEYSGGMMRRLSLILSTIGNDLKILFLDEPTTGLDPLSRRKVWGVIENLKKDKIVVLTTHDMEEADALADHICILHGGKLKASGSSSFLKNRYGKGYQVSMLLKQEVESEKSEKIVNLRAMLEKWIASVLPSGEIVSSAASSVTVAINRGNIEQLSFFLSTLQKESEIEWSVSSSTLEEAFLNLCAINETINAVVATLSTPLCRICSVNNSELVTLYTASKIKVSVQDIVCKQCAEEIVENKNETPDFVIGKACSFETFQTMQKAIETKQTKSGIQPAPIPVSESFETSRVKFVTLSQIKGLIYKNFTLEKATKKTNYCTIFLVLVLNVILGVVVGLLMSMGRREQNQFEERCAYSFSGPVIRYDQYGEWRDWRETCNHTVLAELMTIGDSRSIANGQFDIKNQGNIRQSTQSVNMNEFNGTIDEKSQELDNHDAIANILNLNRIWIPQIIQKKSPKQEVKDGQIVANLSLSLLPPQCFNDYDYMDNIRRNMNSSIYYEFKSKQSYFNAAISTYPDLIIQINRLNIDELILSYEIDVYPALTSSKKFPSLFYTENNASCTIFSVSTDYRYPDYEFTYEASIFNIVNTFSNAFLRKSLNFPYLNATNRFGSDPRMQGPQPGFDRPIVNDTEPVIHTSIKNLPMFYSSNDGGSLEIITSVITIFVLFLCTIFMMPRLVSLWVKEKSSRLFEMMRIQGLSASTYWIGNYLYGFLTTLFINSFALLIGMLTVSVLKNSTYPSLIVLCFITWSHSQVCLAILISSIFKKPSISSLITYLLYLVSSLVASFLLLTTKDASIGNTEPLMAAFFPPIGFSFSMLVAMKTNDSTFFWPVYFIFLAGSTASGILGVYIHLCSKGVTGVSAFDPLFGLGKKFKRSVKVKDIESKAIIVDNDVQIEETAVLKSLEEPLKTNTSAIKIVNLRKEYPKKIAVEDITLNIKFGESFGLLGPNGAGKSTTLSCFTGLTHQTSGLIEVAGQDISKVKHLWSLVGVCPQMDSLWEDLTIHDHLIFYCRLRGIESRAIPAMARRIAAMIELDGDAFQQLASQISGGMKRRLSIGIALTASPRILVLDEPTTGLDPDTRQKIWRVIDSIGQQKDRAIIITTHSMHEADSLCSRIGIVCDGRLKALGNQIHLKNKFGLGFKLSLTVSLSHKMKDVAVNDNSQFVELESKKIVDIGVLLQRVVSKKSEFSFKSNTNYAALRSKINPSTGFAVWDLRLVYKVASKEINIAEVFEKVEKETKEYGIIDWSLNHTTLEDVFINVVEQKN